MNNIGTAFAKVRSSFVVVVCGDDGVVATLNNIGTAFARVRSSFVVVVCADDGGVAKLVVMVCSSQGLNHIGTSSAKVRSSLWWYVVMMAP